MRQTRKYLAVAAQQGTQTAVACGGGLLWWMVTTVHRGQRCSTEEANGKGGV